MEYGRAFRRQAWLIGLVVLVAVVVAAAATTLQTKIYRASMTFVVGQTGGEFQPEIGNVSLTQTITSLFESEVIAEDVIRELDLHTTSEKLNKKLSILVRPSSSVLEVSFVWPDPKRAEEILQAYADSFRELADRKLGISDQTTAFGRSSVRPIIFATVFNPPHADPKQISPSRSARS